MRSDVVPEPEESRAGRPAPSDWRRMGQETFLKGVRLRFGSWMAYRPGWDHDHCSFCLQKFSLRAGDLREGWVTEDDYYWICSDCHADFRAEFDWT